MKASYEKIIRSIPIGLLAVDLERRLIEFNPVAEQITGYERREVLGRICKDLLLRDSCGDCCPCNPPELSDWRDSVITGDAEVMTKSGNRLPIQFICSAIEDELGDVIGALALLYNFQELQSQPDSRQDTLAMIAHDIKNPILSLGSFIDRMARGKAGPVTREQQLYLDVMFKQISRVDQLLDTFIEVSRIKSGSLSLSRAACNVTEELDQVVEIFQMIAKKKNVDIYLELPDKLSPVEADVHQLHRVFFNLLNNALAYTEAPGMIRIRAQEEPTAVCIQFQDSGKGISPQDIPHVFDLYYHKPESSRGGGTGLGLAIAKAIVEAHGGRIQVESELGQGSVFTLSLPKTLTY